MEQCAVMERYGAVCMAGIARNGDVHGAVCMEQCAWSN
jgi:hypothetical protein